MKEMFKFIENIFNFKITWKFRLKFFYFIAKVNALAHFIYVEKRNKVCYSFISTVYGWVWVVYYFLFLTYFLSSLTELVDDGDGSVVLFFANAAEVITVIFKAFIIYFLQVIQSKDLVLLINEAIGISQMIDSKHRESINFYSHRFVKLYNLKKRCIVLQTALLFVSHCYNVVLTGYLTIYMILGGLIVHAHFSAVVVGGLYFYGSLLFGYEFYYSLNGKLIEILKEMEVNQKSRTQFGNFVASQACDELDKISLTYTRIGAFIASINSLFAVQVTLELLGSFIQIASAVSIE